VTGRYALTDSIKQYNAVVSQLHKNVSTLKVQLKRQEETIKKLREELSKAKQENSIVNGGSWVELDDSRNN
jgi:predicted RNase H-like nuclease (RuvC/YqgF family)